MSKKELLVSIKIDSETGKVVALNGAFKQIESTVKQATSTTDKFLKRLTDMAHVVTGIYIVDKALETVKKTLEETVVAGVKLNKTIEDARAGIAALIAANTKGVTDIHKFNVALSMSSDILQKIKKASVDTAATFPQLTEIFNQAIGGALSAGKSFGKNTEEVINNTIKLAQRMSNIANAIGMPMEQVNEEIRSIIEGTITADSRIGKMLHITNEEIKKAKESVGGLAKFLEEKLAPFDVLTNVDTLSRNFARLSDTIDSIRIEATKPIFNDLKNEIKDLSKWLKEHKSDIVYYAKFTYYGLKKLAITINALFISPVRIAFNVVEIIIKKFLTFFVSKLAFLEELLNGLADKFNSLANKIGIDFKIEKSHKFSEWYKKLQDSAKSDIDDIKNAFKEIRNLSKDLTAVDIQFTESVVKATKYTEKQTLALKEQVINKDKLAKIEKQRINIINEINSLLGQTDKFEAIQLKYNQEKEKILKAYKDGIITISQKEELLAKLQEWKNQKELDYVKSLKNVDDYTTRILKNKQAEVDITNKLIKQSKELVKTISDLEDDPYKKPKTRYEDYLKKIQTDTVLSEKQKTVLKLKVDKWYSKELQKLNKQTLEKLQNEYKDYLNENYKFFLSTLDDVNNTLETDFFDALKGKFHNFSDFLKNLFKDVGDSIYDSLAKSISGSIADYLTGSVKKAVVPSFTSFVGVENFAQKLGLKLQDGQYVGEVNGQQVVLDTSGNIVQGADAVKQSFGISEVSNVKSVYDLTTKYFPQVTAALSDVSAGFQTWMSGQALVTPSATATSVNAALMGSEYGQGLATSAWSKAGYYGGGALAGAGIGYGIGTIGDMLFGTDTKAGTYGAIGGAIGSLAGPIGGIIGGAIGSIIGGMFGSKEVTSIGIYVPDSAYFGSDNLRKYEKWEEKSWVSSSSGVDIKGKVSAAVQEYFNSRFKQFDLILEELFNNPSQLTIPQGRYKEDENNPNLTRMILHQFFKTLGMSDDSVKYTKDELVRLWEDYAKGLNKAATDAVIEAFGNVLKAKRNFEVWTAQLKGDSLKALQLQAQYAQKDLEFLKKEYGETELTVDNYLDLMNKAIENSPTPETINKWLELGDALQEATNAQEALKDAIKSEIDKGKAVYENALSLFDNKAITNTKELLEAINNAKPEDTQRILNAINILKQKEIKFAQDNYNTRIEQLQKEKEYLQNISDIVTRLKNIANDLILSTVSDKYYLKAKFNEYLLRVRTDLQNGVNPQDDVENLNTHAKSYANYLKQNASSKQEYLFEVTKMANKINDLADKYDTKDGFKRVEEAINQANIDLQDTIQQVNSTYERYTNLLKLTIEQQYSEYLTTTIDKYEQYLGANSPIIQELRNLQSSITSAINTTNQNLSFNYTPLSSYGNGGSGGSSSNSTDEYTELVNQTYMEVLGRPADKDAIYWVEAVKEGDIAPDNLAESIATAAVNFDKSSYTGDVPEEVLDWSIQNAQNYLKFADGGIVTKPTLGLIGEAGYSEAVIPLKNPNDPMNMNELKEEIRTLKEEIVKLREENIKYQSAIVENTAPIKTSQRYA